MIRALYSSAAGMAAQQTNVDTIAHNLANVNTPGFRRQRAVFQEMTQAAAAPPAALLGGVGQATGALGASVRVVGLQTDHSPGPRSVTGRDLDVAIDGEGFFVVADSDELYYTRNGALALNADGELVTSDGLRLMGWLGGPENVGGPLSPIRLALGDDTAVQATTRISLSGNLPTAAAPGASAGAAVRVLDAQGEAQTLQLRVEFVGSGFWQVMQGAEQVTTFWFAGGAVAPQSEVLLDGGPVILDLAGLTAGQGELVVSATADGQSGGAATQVYIGPGGRIRADLADGQTEDLATIALARFTNQSGLRSVGNSRFAWTEAAGAMRLEAPGANELAVGQLEEANLSVVQEMVGLIMAQRAYEINSKAVQSSDEMLQMANNLRR